MQRNIITRHIGRRVAVLLSVAAVWLSAAPFAGVAAASGSPTISTFAGGIRPVGPALDVGQAPNDLAAAGNRLYVVDAAYDVVREVDLSTGIETVVAGTGVAGFSGDGGPATQAQLNYPRGLALDPAGDLFISDGVNQRVRKIDPSGVITTVAGIGTYGDSGDGGPATQAQIGYPQGLTVDSAGGLLITNGARVRRVDPATGIITTVAGGGTKFDRSADGGPAVDAALSVYDVAVDATGDLFFGDGTSVRRVDGATGVISTIAGNGQWGYSGDGGPAVDAAMTSIFNVTLDDVGGLLIVDSGNDRVRRIDLGTGLISTVVGNGSEGFSGDGGPATAAELVELGDVAMGSGGTAFVSDEGNRSCACGR